MILKQSTFVSGLLLFFACLVTLPSDAQLRQLREADNLIQSQLYDEAISILEPLVKEDNPEAIFLTGFSMMNRHDDMEEAIQMLKKAANAYPLQENKKNSDETLEAHFFLAQAHRLNQETEEAKQKFENLRKHTDDEEVLEEIEREIQYCKNFLKQKEDPVEMKTEHLGKALNSRYDDHSPILQYDESTIYFTSNRPAEDQENEDPSFENIYQSHWRNGQWTEPEILDIPGEPMAHRATVGLTPDGQGLIFFQNDGQNGSLFVTRPTFDGWTDPEPLPEPINSK
ncbi:MAG: tetratricopeptide repeat protein, partial [Bacteroidota bacterium]